jgi:prepilin-type processing-associated H-X9-DG protein
MNDNSIQSPLNAVVFLLCAALIAALMIPTIALHRAAARADGCLANLQQLGLGLHNYHSAYKQLPNVCGGTTGGENDESSNQGRLSGLVGLLPFVEQQRLWEQISNPYMAKPSGQQFPPMGPAPWYDANIYQPWSRSPELYRCPEQQGKPQPAAKPKVVYTLKVADEVGMGLTTNYVFNLGDGTHNIGESADPRDPQAARASRASQRGMFVPGRTMKFRDMLDGLSNTFMMSETRASVKRTPTTGITKNVVGLSDDPSLCLAAAKAADAQWLEFGRGSRWCDGALPITGFQTVLPPNSPSCTSDQGMLDGVISASSAHDGGVHVLFGDGSTAFIADSIESGDPTVAGVHLEGRGVSAPGSRSPYGLWGALGSRASKEVIDMVPRLPNRRGRIAFGQRDDAAKDNYSRWTDKQGEVTLSAKFVRIIDKKTIELEDAAGTLHQVPLNTLRDKDIFRAVSLDLLEK